MKKIILTAFLLSTLSHCTISQELDKNKLDSYLISLESSNKFMGTVAVSQNGTIIYSKSIGYADVESKVKANEDTKYRIGSITKTFTTIVVLKAVEQKKLSLEQSLDTYFPSVPNAGKITIQHLLTHRSGIHNFTDDMEYSSWHTQPKTEKELLDIIVKAGSDFEPGSKASYSNSNFVLLTYILEKVFKKSYTELIQQHVIKPAGLTNTGYGGKIDAANSEAKSYKFLGAWVAQPETDMSIPLGAGAIISTPKDLVKFSEALFGGKLLKPASLELMKTFRDNFGMGLFPMPFNNKNGYGHTGGIDGFNSVFAHFPDDNISYALTANGANYNPNDISIAVLSAVYDQPYAIPVFLTHKVSSEHLDSYVGIYSTKDLPLKITITKDNQTLIAQATGQSAFPLDATAKDKFKYEPAGIVMEFTAAEKKMLLKQGGQEFTFTKE